MFRIEKLELLTFTFCIFHIAKKLYNNENFQLPIFDGFTRFGMPETRFQQRFLKNVCIPVSAINFVATLVKKLIDGFARNFIFSRILI